MILTFLSNVSGSDRVRRGETKNYNPGTLFPYSVSSPHNLSSLACRNDEESNYLEHSNDASLGSYSG